MRSSARRRANTPSQDLVVSAPIMFGRLHVLPVVTRFLEAFRDVAVKLVLTDRVTHFLDDQVDVALRIGDLPDSGLIATRLGTVRRVMCAVAFGGRAGTRAPARAASAEAIEVASMFDLTGDLNLYGVQAMQASHFAVDSINRAGGVLGRPLTLPSKSGTLGTNGRRPSSRPARPTSIP